MVRPLLTVYLDASLPQADDVSTLAELQELGLRVVLVGDPSAVAGSPLAGLERVDACPDVLGQDAWYLSPTVPGAGERARWSRTVVIGPPVASRRSMTGLRWARDVRSAVLELVAETARD